MLFLFSDLLSASLSTSLYLPHMVTRWHCRMILEFQMKSRQAAGAVFGARKPWVLLPPPKPTHMLLGPCPFLDYVIFSRCILALQHRKVAEIAPSPPSSTFPFPTSMPVREAKSSRTADPSSLDKVSLAFWTIPLNKHVFVI